jgi:hypothetical protein
MPKINSDTLRGLADRLKNLFEEYGLEVQWFHFSVIVTQPFYDSIKHDYPIRHPADQIILTSRDENHGVILVRPLNLSSIQAEINRNYRIELKKREAEEKPKEIPEWTQLEGEHIIVLPQGRAVIRQEVNGGITRYNAHIEDNAGNIITKQGYSRKDFESANDYIRANLIELDRVDVDEAAFHQKLAATLDKCIDLFDPAQISHIFHRLRLENIKRWFLNQNPLVDLTDVPKKDWTDYTFNWQEQDDLYQCETLHGKVKISKPLPETKNIFGAPVSTAPGIQIEHETGVTLRDYWPLPDFPSAEARLREILTELEQPYVDESYVEHLTFTLQICLRLLPQDADPMDFVRIEYIDTHLGTVLP